MNIQTVRDNLKNTIAGKELLLEQFKTTQARHWANLEVMHVCQRFLEINLQELRDVLVDVERCCDGIDQ
jgi:hypothetical protein